MDTTSPTYGAIEGRDGDGRHGRDDGSSPSATGRAGPAGGPGRAGTAVPPALGVGDDRSRSVWVPTAVVVAFLSCGMPVWGTWQSAGWRPHSMLALLRELPLRAGVGLVLPGIFAFAVTALAAIDATVRHVAWIIASSVVFVLWVALGYGAFPIRSGPGMLWVVPVVATAVGIATIAAASDLLERDPTSRLGAFVTAGAGLWIVAAFVLPLDHGASWFRSVASDQLPRTSWPIVIAGIGVLVLAALAFAQLSPTPHPSLRRATRFLVWTCAIAVPVGFIAAGWLEAPGSAGFVLSAAVKSFGPLFAVSAVFAAGLRRQLLRAAGAPADASSDPVEALRARLALLDRARDAGILTPEEYAAKRQGIVAGARF